MVKISPFNGPITDMAISEWLSDCEDAFEDWEDENTGKKLSDRQKVHAAGNSISKMPPTDKLHSWWTTSRANLEKKKWNDFRDFIKERALGSGWRLRALQKLYTASQGSQTLEDYFTALENMRFVISRTSKLPNIEDHEFKCHLLFHALPSLTTQTLKNDVHDLTFVNTSIDDIKDQLRKYDTSSAEERTPLPTPTENPTTNSQTSQNKKDDASSNISNTQSPPAPIVIPLGYLIVDCWGIVQQLFTDYVPFNDINTFPDAQASTGQLNKIVIRSNDTTTKYLIDSYQFEFERSLTVNNGGTRAQRAESVDMTLTKGEYISSVTISSKKYPDISPEVLTAMRITTSHATYPSRSLELSRHVSNSNERAFTAPTGWKIIGFRGCNFRQYDSSMVGSLAYAIVGLGAIMTQI